MEIFGLIIALFAAIFAICLGAKMKRRDDLFITKQNGLEYENQQLKVVVNEQKSRIEQLKKEIDESLSNLGPQLTETQRDLDELKLRSKSNLESLTLLMSDDEIFKRQLEMQKKDLLMLREAIKNYTDIKEDSLKLNSIDNGRESFNAGIAKSKATSSNQNKIKFSELDQEKRDIFELMENSNVNFFVTGKAGTGKSFLLRYFRQNTKKNAIYVAPTGISALNIEGETLHRTFGFDNLLEEKTIKMSGNRRKLLSKIDTLVIDEISMVRVDTFNRIDAILKKVMDNDKPFGGKQVLIFGDLFQLPLVSKKNETEYLTDKYGGIYFFNSPAYKSGKFAFYELKNIYRQSEHEFIEILNRARIGKLEDKDIQILNEKFTNSVPTRVVRVMPKKDEAEIFNELNLAEVPSALHTYDAIFPDGTNGLEQNDFPCNFQLQLKEGALVMMIANDLEHNRWVNGTLGIVSKLKDDYVEVTIDGRPYEVQRHTFSTYKCEYNSDTKRIEYKQDKEVEQYPIILAYAITIHKSQGMTYQRIACDLNHCFAAGQAYAALSRCANFDELYLTSKINGNVFFTDSALVEFYNEVSGLR